MRDYDDSFKEMKKENFNLKLRIFFLEERLGSGRKTTADELANNNLELKVSTTKTVLCVKLNGGLGRSNITQPVRINSRLFIF